jgi:hypothetical protein
MSGGVPLFPPLMVPGDGASVPDRVTQGISPPQLAILVVFGVLTVVSFVVVFGGEFRGDLVLLPIFCSLALYVFYIDGKTFTCRVHRGVIITCTHSFFFVPECVCGMKEKLDWDSVARGDFAVVITGVAGVYRPFWLLWAVIKLEQTKKSKAREIAAGITPKSYYPGIKLAQCPRAEADDMAAAWRWYFRSCAVAASSNSAPPADSAQPHSTTITVCASQRQKKRQNKRRARRQDTRGVSQSLIM